MKKIDPTKDKNVTDIELYRRYLEGSNSAFEELVAMYEKELFRFIYRILNDYHETKHLTIEAFARLAVNGKKFAGKSSLKTYLFAIGKNLAATHIKMRGGERHLSFEEAANIRVGEEDTTYDIFERDENRKQLRKYIKNLRTEYHVVLVLLYFEDMSYRQAGRIMNKSEKQIKDLAYRAKKALKKSLESSDFIF